MSIKSDDFQIGLDTSNPAVNDFTLRAPVDGKLHISAGALGTTTDIMTIDSTGDVVLAGDLNVAGSFVSNSSMCFRNKIINGGMSVGQRGTVNTTNGIWVFGGCDRWENYVYGTSTGTATSVSSQASVPTSYRQNLLTVTTTGGNNAIGFRQKIEANNSTCLKGKVVTASGYFYQNTGSPQTLVVALYNAVSYNTFTTANIISGGANVTIPSGAYTRFTASWTLNSTDATVGLQLNLSMYPGNTALTGVYFSISDVQLEEGSAPTPFENRPYQVELSLCQRYYQSFGGNSSFEIIGSGHCNTTSIAYVTFPLAVEMRVNPTLGYSAVADWQVRMGATTSIASALSIGSASKIYPTVSATATGTPLTVGYAAAISAAATTSARLTFSAEL